MSAKKILFISQEITPYVPETPLSMHGRMLPQHMLGGGWEARTFLPKWGNINERRCQLHEVIRLSGMNIIIDETDHALLIKVASIMPTHMQVYFIDNDDFFQKRKMIRDDNGKEYADNAERAIFYARGVIETVKKLRWIPDIVICQGWVSAVVPFYIRTAYQDEPSFANSKIVFALSDEELNLPLPANFPAALAYRSADRELIMNQGLEYKQPLDLLKLALAHSDAVAEATSGINEELLHYAEKRGLPILPLQEEKNYQEAYGTFFNTLLGEDQPKNP